MWKNHNNRAQFHEIVADLLQDDEVLGMRELPQHSKVSNCLDHSIYVAYLSFLFCRRFGLDYVSAARGGLLHDFYLCNWKESDTGLTRLWKHPRMALENAEQRYTLNALEKDIIVKHMWPLTPVPPRHKESFVVSMMDKVAAAMEMCRLYSTFRVKRNLAPVEANAAQAA